MSTSSLTRLRLLASPLLRAEQSAALLPARRGFSSFFAPMRSYLSNNVQALQQSSPFARFQLRRATAAAEGADPIQHAISEFGQYNYAMRWLHWLIAGGIFAAFGTVNAAYYTEGAVKKQLLDLHESVGLGVLGLVLARVGLRLTSKMPPHIPGNKLEQIGAELGHYLLYGFMLFLPVTGVMMNYLGGKPVQFFGLSVPGMANPDLARMTLSKEAFKNHKRFGVLFEYYLPIHIGAAYYHLAKGHNIFVRVNPLVFAK
uniref:Cytochrome b561 bacterial/Ni-hydrogenase domain-containing protein n=1 Tax=Chromera velia CCMP2878 TaxID=1169474 RepID=A0A0G4HYE8_9ALVE|eukprot:Cvel_9491.t1-p1 / transcript=Cvel_9491.t1 / gene=Cvel_9491 / organism=Chromera_velia_CCMP2878 / gene_product=hypothetical protein / transcript_product=hypothetical protein / location=Cvel_scaffold548:62042-64330(-) / protein_length=257 / sequence_SO=supercontig / SO=protein_coding / is_pseudo=false